MASEEVELAAPIGGIFERHHTTSVSFPHLELLTKHEKLVYFAPGDVTTRYEPLPLVAHDGVIRNTGFDNVDNASFVSMTKATPMTSASFEPASTRLQFDSRRLIADMVRLSDCRGFTHLRILTCSPRLPKLEEYTVKISRCSHLELEDGTWNSDHSEYQMFDVVFGAIASSEWGDEAWYRDTVHLMLRDNGRAVRHVSNMLKGHHIEEHLDWLPKRLVKVVPLTNHIIIKPSDFELLIRGEEQGYARLCPICRETYDFANSTPVQLDGCRHILCEACLGNWCDRDIEGASCPMCRARIINPAHTGSVRIGEVANQRVTGNSRLPSYVYFYDIRYSAWKNFGRSCADPDRKLAKNDVQHNVRINGPILKATWTHFVEHARQEPQTSTPRRHNCAFAKEFDIVTHAVLSYVEQTHGGSLKASFLQSSIMAEICRVFFHRFLSSPYSQHVQEEHLEALSTKLGYKHIIDFHPGFIAFGEKLVNRLVNFARLRGCGCEKGELHGHGACRMYYNSHLNSEGVSDEDRVA